MNNSEGKVYLVGAGPGSSDYLTLKGQQILSQTEVIIYDALVDPKLLELAPSECLKINVGKRGGAFNTPQKEIDRLLVKYCLQGKQVVRLKNGDPFVFGRASEEIKALKDAGCKCELIPGISSALAAPLLSGIPLTDKDSSSCFAVLSAHQPENLDWEALSRIDTLVILMGGRSLPTITEKLKEYGRSPLEPIAVIRNCARLGREVWIGTLADIVNTTAGISLSPAVIVVGKVVSLRENLTENTLTGKTIIVTRAAEQSSQFTHMLLQYGAKVIEMPALEIHPPSSWESLDRAIANLSDFHWLILTSANGVEYFFDRLAALGKDARALGGVKIAVVGKKTAASLKQYYLQADFIPPDYVADSVVENFPEPLVGKKVLFPRVETGGREVLVQELTAKGAEVVEVAAYESECPQEISLDTWEALQQKTVDIITFASSKTVRNFDRLLKSAIDNNVSEQTLPSLLENVCIASIGPQTSQSCQECFGRVDIEAKEYTLEGLTRAIIDRIIGN